MSKQGWSADLPANACQGGSSTVILDPEAFLESWKQKIQEKEGIPAEQRRLTFAANNAGEEGAPAFHDPHSCHDSLVKELKTWKAVFKSEEKTIAKLQQPVVVAENSLEGLQMCKSAQALRMLGFPCNVYYLAYSRWVPKWQARRKGQDSKDKQSESASDLYYQVDDDFQKHDYQFVLIGPLNGSTQVLTYEMSGMDVRRRLSIEEQTAEYRRGQHRRHSLATSGNSSHSITVDAGGPASKEPCSGCECSMGKKESLFPLLQDSDFCIPCDGKGQIAAIINSEDRPQWLKCVVLTVITVPLSLISRPRKIGLSPVGWSQQVLSSSPCLGGASGGGLSSGRQRDMIMPVSSSVMALRGLEPGETSTVRAGGVSVTADNRPDGSSASSSTPVEAENVQSVAGPGRKEKRKKSKKKLKKGQAGVAGQLANGAADVEDNAVVRGEQDAVAEVEAETPALVLDRVAAEDAHMSEGDGGSLSLHQPKLSSRGVCRVREQGDGGDGNGDEDDADMGKKRERKLGARRKALKDSGGRKARGDLNRPFGNGKEEKGDDSREHVSKDSGNEENIPGNAQDGQVKQENCAAIKTEVVSMDCLEPLSLSEACAFSGSVATDTMVSPALASGEKRKDDAVEDDVGSCVPFPVGVDFANYEGGEKQQERVTAEGARGVSGGRSSRSSGNGGDGTRNNGGRSNGYGNGRQGGGGSGGGGGDGGRSGGGGNMGGSGGGGGGGVGGSGSGDDGGSGDRNGKDWRGSQAQGEDVGSSDSRSNGYSDDSLDGAEDGLTGQLNGVSRKNMLVGSRAKLWENGVDDELHCCLDPRWSKVNGVSKGHGRMNGKGRVNTHDEQQVVLRMNGEYDAVAVKSGRSSKGNDLWVRDGYCIPPPVKTVRSSASTESTPRSHGTISPPNTLAARSQDVQVWIRPSSQADTEESSDELDLCVGASQSRMGNGNFAGILEDYQTMPVGLPVSALPVEDGHTQGMMPHVLPARMNWGNMAAPAGGRMWMSGWEEQVMGMGGTRLLPGPPAPPVQMEHMAMQLDRPSDTPWLKGPGYRSDGPALCNVSTSSRSAPSTPHGRHTRQREMSPIVYSRVSSGMPPPSGPWPLAQSLQPNDVCMPGNPEAIHQGGGFQGLPGHHYRGFWKGDLEHGEIDTGLFGRKEGQDGRWYENGNGVSRYRHGQELVQQQEWANGGVERSSAGRQQFQPWPVMNQAVDGWWPAYQNGLYEDDGIREVGPRPAPRVNRRPGSGEARGRDRSRGPSIDGAGGWQSNGNVRGSSVSVNRGSSRRMPPTHPVGPSLIGGEVQLGELSHHPGVGPAREVLLHEAGAYGVGGNGVLGGQAGGPVGWETNGFPSAAEIRWRAKGPQKGGGQKGARQGGKRATTATANNGNGRDFSTSDSDMSSLAESSVTALSGSVPDDCSSGGGEGLAGEECIVSCKAQAVLEAVVSATMGCEPLVNKVTGAPLVEFERLLMDLTPQVVLPLDGARGDNNVVGKPGAGSSFLGVQSSGNAGRDALDVGAVVDDDKVFEGAIWDHESLQRHRTKLLEKAGQSMMMEALWKWYDSVGAAGVQVATKEGDGDGLTEGASSEVLAYFVPFLSSIQLFEGQCEGCSRARETAARKAKGGANGILHCCAGSRRNDDASVDPVEMAGLGRSAKQGADPPAATAAVGAGCKSRQAPEPFVEAREEMPGPLSWEGSHENGCSDVRLLFEFFEGQQPHSRMSLSMKRMLLLAGERDECGEGDLPFEESKESTSGGCNVRSVLDAKLCDLHPASWFSVAWYPIYRIPEGPLRSVFLTFHSLAHWEERPVPCTSSPKGQQQPQQTAISFPVVGLAWYNSQHEHWFSVPKSLGNSTTANGIVSVVGERLKRLETVAATMARPLESPSVLHKHRPSVEQERVHHDYEFFMGRRVC